jgi:hypothetical protein
LPDPSVVGQSVTISYNVAVVAPGKGTPTGDVTVSDGTQSCTGNAAAGKCSITFATLGEKTLIASYVGNKKFNGSASTPISHTVNPANQVNTTTTITSDLPDPSTTGQPVTVNVKVHGTGVTPTGTVAITGADINCTASLADGNGSCNVVFNTAGAKILTATYNGDFNYLGSSANASHTVNRNVSTTTITGDTPDPSLTYQSVTVSATVIGAGDAPTGTVGISITGVPSVCTIVLEGGTGSCAVVFETNGIFTITATYSGDSNYLGSVDTEIHTVSKVSASSSTTVIMADNPDPSLPGQSVAVSVMVSGAGTTPTGTVAVSGADTNCTITLSDGTGSCNVIFNTTGAKTITATYSGDSSYASSSDTDSHIVSEGSTTTTITSDEPDPSLVGQAVTITYNVTVVAPASGTPTGNVTVSDGTQSCSGSVAAGSCSITFATPGEKSLTATYLGDANFNGSVSTPATAHTVNSANLANTTTTITSDEPDPSLVGQAVSITYSVAVVAPASGTPTGNVTVSDGTQSCTGDVAAGSCSIAFATPGMKALTATYAGDADYNGSISSPATAHTVNSANLANTITTITSDEPDPSLVGQAVTITYSVAVVAPGTGMPTGSVTVSDGTQSCSGSVAAGSCSIAFATPGVKALTATYAGDANFNGSVSTPATAHTVNSANLANTTTTITSDEPDPSLVGQAVTITYNVAVVAPGTGMPTGTVTVSDGTQSCTGSVAAGSCSIAFATPGMKALTATYAGDANYNGSISSPATAHRVNRTNILFIALICLAVYSVLAIAGIALFIYIGRRRRKARKSESPYPSNRPIGHDHLQC